MKKTAIAIFTLLAFAVAVLAQSNTGRLVGTVAGPDGVVPGATVIVKDDKTGREKTIVSGGDGGFILPQLEVGAYTVKVTANGFKSFTANEVKIDIGREYSLSVALEVGSVSDSVTITAGNDVLNATNAELSNTISQKQILELPLQGRNPLTSYLFKQVSPRTVRKILPSTDFVPRLPKLLVTESTYRMGLFVPTRQTFHLIALQ